MRRLMRSNQAEERSAELGFKSNLDRKPEISAGNHTIH